MTDIAPDTGNTNTPDTADAPDTGTTPLADMSIEEQLEYFKSKARKAEDLLRGRSGDPNKDVRALRKERDALKTEVDQIRQSSMSDQEKAIETAKVETRLATIGEMGGKLAAAEIKAAAAGRFDPEQLSALVDNLNLASFLGDDGEVDAGKVSEFVNSIAPAKTETEDDSDTERVLKTFDLGQGARGDQSLSGDAFTKALVAKVGGPRR